MTREEGIFLGILVVNLVLAVLYLLYGFLFAGLAQTGEQTRNGGQDQRGTYLFQFFVMLLCPIVGFVFFFLSWLLAETIFRFGVNLDDIMFSKERVETQVKADEEQGRNIIPLEEALVVNDKKSLRVAMLSIIRGETQSSLSAIALALNAEDSETAHYAASVLSDMMNEFRINVRRMYSVIQEDPENLEEAGTLIDYMDHILKQNVFTQLEQDGYVRMMEDAADLLYQKSASHLTAKQYEKVCLRLMEAEDFQASEQWCMRLANQYPRELSAYTCRLKLFFRTKNKEAFFHTLDSLKKTDVVIDSETLEIIRIFS